MKIHLSKKDQSLLIGLAGIIILAVAWLLIYNPLNEKTNKIEMGNIELKAKSDLYQSINANLSQYEQDIDDMKEDIAAISNQYPVHISREDEIMFLANMENMYSADLVVENITMSVVEEIIVENKETADTAVLPDTAVESTESPETSVENAEEVQSIPVTEVHLYKQPVNYTFRCTYKGVKEMIQYLFAQTNKKEIEGMSLAFDSETGNLMGALDLNQFYMVGIDKDYQSIKVPALPKGVKDVFHTISGAGVNAVTDFEETDEAAEAAEE